MATPQYESPIPIENQGQVAVIAVSLLSIFIPIVFVGLRLYARLLTGRRVDGSDYLILAALVSIQSSVSLPKQLLFFLFSFWRQGVFMF